MRDADIARLLAELRDTRSLSRRDLILASLGAAGALAGGRLIAQAARATNAAPVIDGLRIHNARPLDAESTLDVLASPITPAERFFVRSHFGPPRAAPARWTLTIDGLVGKPATLALDDLRRMPARTQTVTIECAGNGRGAFALPKTSGIQWQRGAVGTAEWTGVPLGTLLEQAGVASNAAHFWMEAADRAPMPGVPKFMRSIPRDVAMGEVLVAWAMNGAPIPALHGGPLRLIVPGWHGMASTKWLTHVHARADVSDNHFMARSYRYADGSPVESMRVKSVIAAPLDGARVRLGALTVRGQAWTGASGGGGIRGVDVSEDGGRTWRPARLVGEERAGAWRGWEYDARIDQAGPRSVMARATDRSGAVQPMVAQSNPSGYGNNSVHEVRFDAIQS